MALKQVALFLILHRFMAHCQEKHRCVFFHIEQDSIYGNIQSEWCIPVFLLLIV